MPLMSCPDCGREVSPRARMCVHCGRPWPSCGPCSGLRVLLAVVLAGALAVGGAVAIKRCHRCCEARQKAERCLRLQKEQGERSRFEAEKAKQEAQSPDKTATPEIKPDSTPKTTQPKGEY